MIKSVQSHLARALFEAGLTPSLATAAGLVLGMASGLCFATGARLTGIWMLAMSAVLDALDGTIARECAAPTLLGGIFDLCADRIVEIAVLIGIVWSRPMLHFPALVLVGSWYINITVFLATGAVIPPAGKVIAYPPGLVERTEAIIFFILLAISGDVGPILCYSYTALEIATVAQRSRFAWSRI